MSRSLGVAEAVHSIVPEEAALALGLLTQLGDTWFLLMVVVLAYWLRPDDRERTAVVLAIAISAIALLQGLKGFFSLPRPATPLTTVDTVPVLLRGLFEATATAGGHGFPSGHATLSTAVLLGLVGAVRIGSPRRRAGLAIGLIVLVSFTRVALGVHFLVDVIAGMLVGLMVLAGTALAVRSTPCRAPTAAFGLAVAVGLASLALATGPVDPADAALVQVAHDPFLAFAVALGAFGGWQAYLYRSETVDRDRRLASSQLPGDADGTVPVERATVQALIALGVVHALLALGLAGVIVGDATAAQAGAAGIAAALVVALPALVPGFDASVLGYLRAVGSTEEH